MHHLENLKREGLGYILNLSSSYCKSRVLFVATDIGVFTVLSRTKKNILQVTKELRLEPRPAEMLLNACVALGLLEKKDGFYSNTPSSELFLVKGKPMYVGEAFNMMDKRSYKLWGKLKEAVKANKPQAYEESGTDLFEGMTKNKEEMNIFFKGLHALAYWPANSLAQSFDFTAYRHLLDVGGGSGAYSIAIIKRHKHLKATVFDLPPVLEITREFIEKENLSHRISTCSGDFLEDDFPQGVDLILFSNVLHDWNEMKVEQLLRKAFESITPGGGVIISDLVLNNDATEPLHAALMSLTLLLETQGGSNYTEAQYTYWLEMAGFQKINIKPITGSNKIVTATKP